MVVQFLINWDDILSSIDVSHNTREQGQLLGQFRHLAQLIKQNGCLIDSHYVESSLVRLKSKENMIVDWKMALTDFYRLYKDFGLKVDVENKAGTFEDTITSWKLYLGTTGITFGAKDGRCVLLAQKGKGEGEFYKVTTLSEYINKECGLSVNWSALQHFSATQMLDFTVYLESFSATAKEIIRVYDPYLSDAFLPLSVADDDSARRRAWRNSLKLLMSVFLKNDNIHKYDIVTLLTKRVKKYLKASPTVNQLLVTDVVCGFLGGAVAKRKTPAKISFHFLDKDTGCDFHDRFLVNGRFCFAIGHGCDVCCEETDTKTGQPKLTSFNVFYGCSSKMCPCGLPVFSRDNTDCDGRSDMYPSGCYARSFKTIKAFFKMPNNNGTNEFSVPCGQSVLTCRVNPLTTGVCF